MKKLEAPGTVANISGYGKLARDRTEGVLEWSRKRNAWRKTSIQIQADFQVQGTIVSNPTICCCLNENGLHGRNPTSKMEIQKEKRGESVMFWGCFAAQALAALSLCRSQWNQETIKAFWSQAYSPVSEICLILRFLGTVWKCTFSFGWSVGRVR